MFAHCFIVHTSCQSAKQCEGMSMSHVHCCFSCTNKARTHFYSKCIASFIVRLKTEYFQHLHFLTISIQQQPSVFIIPLMYRNCKQQYLYTIIGQSLTTSWWTENYPQLIQVISQAPNTLWFKLLKCENILLFSVLYHSKLNILRFKTVGQNWRT